MDKYRSRIAMLVLAAVALIGATLSVRTLAASDDCLVGRITSDAEGRMEGVLVIAQREGSAVLTAVVTDAQGRYRFPRTHLGPGNYKIMTRAAGYVIPNGSASSRVYSGRTAELNLHLRQATTDELAHQLTNVDWWTSMPARPRKRTC